MCLGSVGLLQTGDNISGSFAGTILGSCQDCADIRGLISSLATTVMKKLMELVASMNTYHCDSAE